MGYTRNAILGRLWRLRKERGDDVVAKKHSVKPANAGPPKKRVRRKVPFAPTAPKSLPLPPMIELPADLVGVNLLDLELAGCRFVINSVEGRDPVHLYCGRDASEYR